MHTGRKTDPDVQYASTPLKKKKFSHREPREQEMARIAQENFGRKFGTNLKNEVFPCPNSPRVGACGVLVTDGNSTSAQQKPRQWYHRRLSALQ